MPNEKIHRTTTGTNVPASDNGIPAVVSMRECLTVSWLPDCEVQVGVEFECLSGTQGDAPHSAWMNLNRHEINRVIKALRRARDSAYGRDE
jgi:hypothetical protein